MNTTATVTTMLAWDLRHGMLVRNTENHETRRVAFVGPTTRRDGTRPVYFVDDGARTKPWRVGSFTEVEVVG